jgi:hypothetical protein
MKPSLSILIVAALLAFIASNGPANVEAKASPVHTSFTELWRGLPLPIAHLHCAGSALVFELGYRSAGTRTAPAGHPVTLRLIVSQSGKAELVIHSHFHRLVFPRRSA